MHDSIGVRSGRARSRRFWIVTAGQVAAVVVTVGGLLSVRQGSGAGSIPPAFAVTAAIALFLLATVGTWMTFRVTDELDQRDTLIAFTFGFIAQMAIFCVWGMLWVGGLAGYPDSMAIFTASGVGSLLVYIAVKARR